MIEENKLPTKTEEKLTYAAFVVAMKQALEKLPKESAFRKLALNILTKTKAEDCYETIDSEFNQVQEFSKAENAGSSEVKKVLTKFIKLRYLTRIKKNINNVLEFHSGNAQPSLGTTIAKLKNLASKVDLDFDDFYFDFKKEIDSLNPNNEEAIIVSLKATAQAYDSIDSNTTTQTNVIKTSYDITLEKLQKDIQSIVTNYSQSAKGISSTIITVLRNTIVPTTPTSLEDCIKILKAQLVLSSTNKKPDSIDKALTQNIEALLTKNSAEIFARILKVLAKNYEILLNSNVRIRTESQSQLSSKQEQIKSLQQETLELTQINNELNQTALDLTQKLHEITNDSLNGSIANKITEKSTPKDGPKGSSEHDRFKLFKWLDSESFWFIDEQVEKIIEAKKQIKEVKAKQAETQAKQFKFNGTTKINNLNKLVEATESLIYNCLADVTNKKSKASEHGYLITISQLYNTGCYLSKNDIYMKQLNTQAELYSVQSNEKAITPENQSFKN